MKAIWKIPTDTVTYWFETRKEAVAYCRGAQFDDSRIIRVPIACYLNPRQLVYFINENFPNNIIA